MLVTVDAIIKVEGGNNYTFPIRFPLESKFNVIFTSPENDELSNAITRRGKQRRRQNGKVIFQAKIESDSKFAQSVSILPLGA